MRELKRKKGIINPDLTPLIDVVFQLLIFFMLVTTFSQYTKFSINLPKSNTESVAKVETKLELIIDKNEKYFLKDGEKVVELEESQIENKITNILSERKNKDMVVSADKDLRYEIIIKTMGKLKNIGMEKIEINSLK